MPANDDDYLQLSGIQHFTFCRRRWALIHIEEAWSDNLLTVEGRLMHEHAHNPFFTEKRGDIIITREMPIFSKTLGVSGQCDVVEFYADKNGVDLHGRIGLWLPRPIEYKHGSPQMNDSDRLQLCAQAMCLEEMLLCPAIDTAYLYYGETRRREAVDLTPELRETVRTMFAEMRQYYERRYTPRVKPTKACKSCSLKDICLPRMPKSGSVREYIDGAVGGAE
ncbi:CRISPR-associated protein Cas4 [Synergistales bacterium]|nr:CRISPR-associated protein Cas4 [Synergistales bacterium]